MPEVVAYSADDTRLRQGLLALVSLAGELDQRPALAVADAASAAAALAAQAPSGLARLLTAAATTYAAAAAAALRMLPGRARLGLDVAGNVLVHDLLALVSNLLGSDVALGLVAEPEPPVIESAWPYQLAYQLAREHVRLDLAVARGTTRRRADDAIPVESDSVDEQLPVHVEDVVIVSNGREQHTVRGKAFFSSSARAACYRSCAMSRSRRTSGRRSGSAPCRATPRACSTRHVPHSPGRPSRPNCQSGANTCPTSGSN